MARIIDFKLKSFIPKSERGEENPLTWFYKEPDFGMQRLQLPKQKFKISDLKKMKGKQAKEAAAQDVEIDFDLFNQQRETLAYCLRDVANLSTVDGPVKIPATVEERATLIDLLPRDLMQELFHFIVTGEDLPDAEEETEENESTGEPKNGQGS